MTRSLSYDVKTLMHHQSDSCLICGFYWVLKFQAINCCPLKHNLFEVTELDKHGVMLTSKNIAAVRLIENC